MSNLRIFGLGVDYKRAERISNYLHRKEWEDYQPSRHHEERRPDGEAYTTALDNVRGCDVFVISSLYTDSQESVDDKLVKLCVFINTLRHASADRITVVAPYLCYMRQDRKTESRAPISTQAIALMLESVGAKRLLTMDVHNLAAEQNAFRIPIDNLEAKKLLADAYADISKKTHGVCEYVVLAPDAGGVKRAEDWRDAFQRRLGNDCMVDFAFTHKKRFASDKVEVKIVGDIKDKQVIVVDDMISTGSTLAELRNAAHRHGAIFDGVVATHGLFVGQAEQNLQHINNVVITDTVEQAPQGRRQIRVSTDRMFAEAIYRIHTEGGSISQLLEDK